MSFNKDKIFHFVNLSQLKTFLKILVESVQTEKIKLI